MHLRSEGRRAGRIRNGGAQPLSSLHTMGAAEGQPAPRYTASTVSVPEPAASPSQAETVTMSLRGAVQRNHSSLPIGEHEEPTMSETAFVLSNGIGASPVTTRAVAQVSAGAYTPDSAMVKVPKTEAAPGKRPRRIK